jgi:hypothetical protein
MSEKPVTSGTTPRLDGRGPVGKVKPGLVEPQGPNRNWTGPETVVDAGTSPPRYPRVEHAGAKAVRAGWAAMSGPEDPNGAPKPTSDVRRGRNARSPTGREP